MPLTEDYINAHRADVHTPDSWARSIIEKTLQTALEEVKSEPKESVEINATITVSAFAPGNCATVCVSIPSRGVVCYHIPHLIE